MIVFPFSCLNEKDMTKVLCELIVDSVYPYTNGDSCNLYCTTPSGDGVAFISPNTNFVKGQKILAVGRNTDLGSCACNYTVLPIWDGQKTIHPFEISKRS